MLAGFGVSASFARLREACETSIDGTSIDALEELIQACGVGAAQTMIPSDVIPIAEARALPAIVVLETPVGNHFVAVWRRLGPFVQIMDPAQGRRWLRWSSFCPQLLQHRTRVGAAAWHAFAQGAFFCEPLRRRIRDLGARRAFAERVLAEARASTSPRGLATLDAATRLLTALTRSGAVRRGAGAERVLERVVQLALAEAAWCAPILPEPFWSVLPGECDSDGEASLLLSGAVLITLNPEATGPPEASESQPTAPRAELERVLGQHAGSPLQALREPLRAAVRPWVALLWLGLMGVAALCALGQNLLYPWFLDLGGELGFGAQRVGAIAMLLCFIGLQLALELPLLWAVLRIGSRLEAGVRLAFMHKLPRIADRYFSSRLSSDLAERSHHISSLRGLGLVGQSIVQYALSLGLSTWAVAWLSPANAPLALGLALGAVLIPLLFQPTLAALELAARAQQAGANRLYLDSLVGLLPLRTHAGERHIRREHESALVGWVRTSMRLYSTAIAMRALQMGVCTLLAIWILMRHATGTAALGGLLLLVFFLSELPALGLGWVQALLQLPALRSVALRVLEPLGAPEKAEPVPDPAVADRVHPETRPAARVQMHGVAVQYAGHVVLRDIDLDISPAEHVAVVGRSGSGKSTLLSLILGWNDASQGQVSIDGVPLDTLDLDGLRGELAWLEPGVQLWNRSLLENIAYGAAEDATGQIEAILERAALRPLLQRLPHGLATELGESGARVSGGEGQRVRFARALARSRVRLAVLDEPFRGLDVEQRRRLLRAARERWRKATLFCVTHDVEETRSFDRVLVVEDGRVVEDGAPEVLAAAGSRYFQLLSAERAMRRSWNGSGWERCVLADGAVSVRAAGESSSLRPQLEEN